MPSSPLRYPYAIGPRTAIDALLMPASSLSWRSSSSILNSLATAHAEYIRNIMSAQSLASVPPSRALIVRIAPAPSLGPLSSAFSSRSSRTFSNRVISSRTSSAIDSSSWAISNSASRSSTELDNSSIGSTMVLSDFSSAMTFWAASLSSQKSGRLISVSISPTRVFLPAWSKRVSELDQTLADLGGTLRQFGVHDGWVGEGWRRR